MFWIFEHDISSSLYVHIAFDATLGKRRLESDHHDCIEPKTAVFRADREMVDILDHLCLQRRHAPLRLRSSVCNPLQNSLANPDHEWKIRSFSGVIVTENFLETHDLVGPARTQMLSTVTAIYDIGCFVGAMVAFTIGERLGRTRSIIVGTMIMTVGAILMCSSFSLAQMFVGRIVLG